MLSLTRGIGHGDGVFEAMVLSVPDVRWPDEAIALHFCNANVQKVGHESHMWSKALGILLCLDVDDG